MENRGSWSSPGDRRLGAGPKPGRHPLSPSRRAILEHLHGQPQPLTLAALARITGLHPNTVREHLDALVRRGLVRRLAGRPQGRGRPAYLFEHVEHGPGEYARLAVALADALASSSSDPAGHAAAVGVEWGRELARERRARTGAGEDARSEVVGQLDDLGFEPRRGADDCEVLLTRCPLLEAAHRAPAVVCGIHLGIIRGMLDEFGADPSGSELEPFAAPGYCRLVVPPV
ncbi:MULTISPECIES: helix-turn-helix domain-containing protein [unclassified Nocardioides]|uniref:helix-turn-helix transcriptional regulator n=1 Tax=unclassified Nocardioides TaxID=2615069 RepID=UPI0000EB618A|nr:MULTISPECIES: helix-turn-helix domain-containing protein [unclassified Nocardioides]ABL80858.1 transcriptional regulator, ArsR family [Nocardioides sp. JS614]